MKKNNFETHIIHIKRKIACGVGISTKLKYYFSKEILLQLYHVIYPHLQYFMLFLYGDPHIKPIFKKYLLFKIKQLKL